MSEKALPDDIYNVISAIVKYIDDTGLKVSSSMQAPPDKTSGTDADIRQKGGTTK